MYRNVQTFRFILAENSYGIDNLKESARCRLMPTNIRIKISKTGVTEVKLI